MALAGWARNHRRLLLSVAVPAAIALAYAGFILPWHVRWGATQQEVDSVLPGDYLIPRAKIHSTRAVVIHRPPHDIFPWLLQVGQKRGCFYSYEWLENMIGCQIQNADRLHAEWQN